MNVFLAGIMQGSKVEAAIHAQDWREPIRRAFAGHVPPSEVYCHFEANPRSIDYELPDIRVTFEEGLRRARQCDVLVAYLPSASMGTAIEMVEAYHAGTVVLTITPMALNWVVRLYSHRIFATVAELEAFLASGQLDALLQQSRSGE